MRGTGGIVAIRDGVWRIDIEVKRDSPGLDYVSCLLGDEHLPARLSDRTVTAHGRHENSVATVPLVPPAALRRLHPGDALLIHGTLPPAHLRLRPWYRDRRLKQRA